MPPSSGGYLRWVVCTLPLFATSINDVDRQIVGIHKPTLTRETGWSDELIYSGVVVSFQLACAIGMLAAGRVIDRIAASAWLVALVVIHLLVPRLEPARVGDGPAQT